MRTYTEGKELFITHKSYERNSQLSIIKKEHVLNKDGCLKCEVCGFDFYTVYGERGYGFIECHHNRPVSEMEGEGAVSLEELSLLCSNCHRMIHRAKPWMSVEELQRTITQSY
ncbi:HNH endonuclease [Desulforhopalus singaporensis]|uniref:HNH endonuclease n=1 Tax=Desulforhopalus singaporensis TaxID=91360 RepID=UPI001C409630